MPPPIASRHSPARLQRPGSYRGILALIIAGSLCGCSIWDLGPQPDSYVGPGRKEGARSLTDPGLQAVLPDVPGDHAGGAAEIPGAAMPNATQPATTGPAAARNVPTTQASTRPTYGNGVTPHAEIPQALSVQEAILVGLQNNTSLVIQRYAIPQSRLNEDRALAAFDPNISGTVQGGRNGSGRGPSDSVSANVSASEFLPTGTTINGTLNTTNNFYTDASSQLGANVTVTQALLRGAGLDVNLASLREAEIATRRSQYQIRDIAEQLVADIEIAYWNLAYDERQVIIVQNSIDVALKQYNETQQRIRVGSLAASELPSAESTVAARRVNLIDAKSTLESDRLRLLSLLTPAPQEFWNRDITLTTLPFIPTGTSDPVDSHVSVALRFRPDVNEAKLEIQRGDLEVVRTKNGLLPKLDLFLTLGKTTQASNFGNSITGINGPDYRALVGVNFNFDPINRAEIASYRSAQLTKEQLKETLDNTYQGVELDIRSQYIEVERARQQIPATRAARIAFQEQLTVEQAKLAAGNGTSINVSVAELQLVQGELQEVQAVTSYLKALVSLYRLEGSLLYRRGLDAPGANPVDGPAWRK